MKHMTFIVVAITATFGFTAPAFAVDEHHPENVAAPPKAPDQSSQVTVKEMQENVKKMRAQLDRVANAKTDAEKQKVLAEHMHTMQDNMKKARSIEGSMGMGCPMMGKGMMEDGVPAERMQMMERRMDMMEQMLKQQGRDAAPMSGR